MKAAPLTRTTGRTPPRAFAVEKPMPWLAKYRRKAVRLHPALAKSPLPVEASKFGGQILWPAAEPWPYCRERNPAQPMAMPAWPEFLKMEREMKLSAQLAERGGPPPPKASSRDPQQRMAAQEAWNKQVEAEFAAAKAKGRPVLTAKEVEEARVAYDQMKDVNAKLALPHNSSYMAIAQLRRDDFPELPWPARQDLMQLLWCPHVHFFGNHRLQPGERRQQSAGFVFVPVQLKVEEMIQGVENLAEKEIRSERLDERTTPLERRG